MEILKTERWKLECLKVWNFENLKVEDLTNDIFKDWNVKSKVIERWKSYTWEMKIWKN